MGNLSTFIAPNYTIDEFITHFEIGYSDLVNVARYQVLLLKESKTEAEQTEFNNLMNILKDKLITAESFNHLQDCIINMEVNFQTILSDFQDSVNATMAKYSDKGFWDGSTTYQQWNTISYDGQTYRSKQDNNLNHTPVGDISDLWWILTAKRGTQGIPGLGLSMCGQYNNSATYIQNQAVTYGGNVYYALQTTTGNIPSSSSAYWDIFQSNIAPIIQDAQPSNVVNGQVWIQTGV